MEAFIQRVFKIRKRELGLVLALGFLLFGNSLARQVSGIVAVSGFLNSSSVNSILLVMLIDYTLILIVGGLQSLVVDRYNRVKLIGFVSVGFALVFIILRVMFAVGAPGWLNYSIMYLIAEQQLILFPVIFWVLANDIFNFAQAQRLFPLIASWSFVGKLAGIGIAAASPTLFGNMGLESEEILLFNALIYVIGFFLIVVSLRKVSVRTTVQQTETVRETLTEGWDFVKGVELVPLPDDRHHRPGGGGYDHRVPLPGRDGCPLCGAGCLPILLQYVPPGGYIDQFWGAVVPDRPAHQ